MGLGHIVIYRRGRGGDCKSDIFYDTWMAVAGQTDSHGLWQSEGHRSGSKPERGKKRRKRVIIGHANEVDILMNNKNNTRKYGNNM